MNTLYYNTMVIKPFTLKFSESVGCVGCSIWGCSLGGGVIGAGEVVSSLIGAGDVVCSLGGGPIEAAELHACLSDVACYMSR